MWGIKRTVRGIKDEAKGVASRAAAHVASAIEATSGEKASWSDTARSPESRLVFKTFTPCVGELRARFEARSPDFRGNPWHRRNRTPPGGVPHSEAPRDLRRPRGAPPGGAHLPRAPRQEAVHARGHRLPVPEAPG